MFARRYYAATFFAPLYFPASQNSPVTFPGSVTTTLDAAVAQSVTASLSLDAMVKRLGLSAGLQLDAVIHDATVVVHLERVFRAKRSQIKRAPRH